MKTYKTLTKKIDFGEDSLEIKVRIKYKWDTAQRLEDRFHEGADDLTHKYKQIGAGEAKFITLLVECEFANMVGSDCLGTVWIDQDYTIEDCIKENRMIFKASEDLLKKMSQTYETLKELFL